MSTKFTLPDEELLAIATSYDLGPTLVLQGKFQWYFHHPDESSAPRYRVGCNLYAPTAFTSAEPKWVIYDRAHNRYLKKSGSWRGINREREQDRLQRLYDSAAEAILYYRYWAGVFSAWAFFRVHTDPDPDAVVLTYDQCSSRKLTYRAFLKLRQQEPNTPAEDMP